MAYRRYTDHRSEIYDSGYEVAYDHRPIRLPALPDNCSEPNVFLDLRNYFTVAKPSNRNPPSRNLESYHSGRSNLRSEDHIYHPSTSHFGHSRADYISRPTASSYHRAPPPAPDPKQYHDSPRRNTDYASSWDKSDYQMIREGGWRNKKHFMESHGLSIYEPGDFDEAKEILDGYRREDAQAAEERLRGSDYSSRYADRCDSHHTGERDDTCGSESISYYEDDQHIPAGDGEFSSNHSRRVHVGRNYDESSVRGNDDGREDTNGSDEDDDSSDSDSTDAIDYCSSLDAGDKELSSDYREHAGYYDESSVRGDGKHSAKSNADEGSSDCDSTDAIDYYSDSDVNEDVLGGDDFVDDDDEDY